MAKRRRSYAQMHPMTKRRRAAMRLAKLRSLRPFYYTLAASGHTFSGSFGNKAEATKEARALSKDTGVKWRVVKKMRSNPTPARRRRSSAGRRTSRAAARRMSRRRFSKRPRRMSRRRFSKRRSSKRRSSKR